MDGLTVILFPGISNSRHYSTRVIAREYKLDKQIGSILYCIHDVA